MNQQPIITKNYSHVTSTYSLKQLTFFLLVILAFNGFWIDGSDEITKHNWLFADGTPITEFHWGPGEPAAIGNEDCLIMGSIVDYDWNNLACSQMREYICEIV